MSDFSNAIKSIHEKLKKSLDIVRTRCEEFAEAKIGAGCPLDKYQLMRSESPRQSKKSVDLICDSLGHPPACTRGEIVQAIRDHLSVSAQEHDSAFDRMISLLHEEASYLRRSEPFLLVSGSLHVGKIEELDPIWDFHSASSFVRIEVSGYSLNDEKLGFFDDEYYVECPSADGIENRSMVTVRSVRIEARVRACCSQAAMESLSETAKHVVPSLFRSGLLLQQAQNNAEYDRWLLEFDDWFSNSEEEFFSGDMKDGPDPIVVFTDEGRLGSDFLWIHEALGAFFRTGTVSKKKDTFEKRIQNAIMLTAEADSQKNTAIKIALCVIAIEALLGRKGNNDISRTLSENIAVLLEPDLDQRLNAETFVKQLYDIRSQVLHGAAIDADNEKAWLNSRLLAAGVLKAFIECVLFSQRFSDSEPVDTPEKLLALIKRQKYNRGQPIGIQESSARILWIRKNEA